MPWRPSQIWVYSSQEKAEAGQGYAWEFTLRGDRLAVVDHFHEGEKVYDRLRRP